ncbi:hypothetical protein M3Y99_00252100 [Aphelenchoides fujianensis]|nr:hypothetical protein M3Y99_00252100 [Aphelenchoides fujianensis]
MEIFSLCRQLPIDLQVLLGINDCKVYFQEYVGDENFWHCSVDENFPCDNENVADWCFYVGDEFVLPQSNEIFRMNRYGTIKQRLTNNAFFEGELAVSPDFRRVVFASNRDGDYDLYIADLNDMENPKRITNTLGYEGGVQFAPDGRSIAFFAWRPQTLKAQEFYRWLLSYNDSETSQMDVYLLDLESGVETKVTDFAALSRLPELNNTWSLPYFSFAPSGELYIRQEKQFYRTNRLSPTSELTKLMWFPNDAEFTHFQLRSNETIVAVTVPDRDGTSWIIRGTYNFSATYDIHRPQIDSASPQRSFDIEGTAAFFVLFSLLTVLY